MAIYAKFKAAGTDIAGTAHNVTVTGMGVPDLNAATLLTNVTHNTGYSGGAGGKGQQSYSLSCAKRADDGTPKLLQALDQNQVFEGTIYFTEMAEGTAGSNEECYMTMEITKGRITGQSVSASGLGDRATENLTIQYDTLLVTFKGGVEYVISWAKRGA